MVGGGRLPWGPPPSSSVLGIAAASPFNYVTVPVLSILFFSVCFRFIFLDFGYVCFYDGEYEPTLQLYSVFLFGQLMCCKVLAWGISAKSLRGLIGVCFPFFRSVSR